MRMWNASSAKSTPTRCRKSSGFRSLAGSIDILRGSIPARSPKGPPSSLLDASDQPEFRRDPTHCGDHVPHVLPELNAEFLSSLLHLVPVRPGREGLVLPFLFDG